MNDANHLVSVVIPCYNAEDYVEECIASVLAQRYANLEIICVDDGSTDGTAQILDCLRKKHADRIRVLPGEHRGAPAARNKGIAAAQGAYIQLLDADDLLLPGKIEHQMALIRQCGYNPDLVAGAYSVRHLNGREEDVSLYDGDDWVALIRTRLGITGSNLWRRESIEAVGGFDEAQKSSQEAELMFRLLQRGARIVFDHELLTVIRKTPGSITTSNEEAKLLRRIDLRKRMFSYLEEQGLLTPEREQSLYRDFFQAILCIYTNNRSAALALHRELIPTAFVPRRGKSGVYPVLYRMAGLDIAEKAVRTWGRVRHKLSLS